MIQCKNCLANFEGNFCPNCGTAAHTRRIDWKYLLHEAQHGIFHFEKGFLFTLKELMIWPGPTVKGFIEGERAKHYKPVGFAVVTSIIYVIVKHLLHFNEPVDKSKLKGNSIKIITWITENYHYSNLIEIVFIAAALSLFFRKRAYNYFEYLVLMCYLTGAGMILGMLGMIISHFSGSMAIYNFGFLLIIVYTIWGIGQFFADGKGTTYIKAFFAYLTGSILLILSIILFIVALKILKITL